MYKVLVDVIHGNKWINDFMHTTDTFEKGRILGNHSYIEVEVEDDCNVFTLADEIASMYTKLGEVVSFVGLNKIDGKHITYGTHYFKPNLQTISNGKQWGMACEMISKLGYLVETNERRILIKVSSKNEESD